MTGFPRNIAKAQSSEFDLIIVGAGIYGICLTLEATQRGLRPLLLERDDFGGATSLNSLRILHGGLRYLQSLDLPRFYESTHQRNWFMSNFKEICRPLQCIMPLYGKGLKRSSIFRCALFLNDALSGKLAVGKSELISAEELKERIPLAVKEGLQGGAVWYDGQILSPQRLHAELLRWACSLGAQVLNYTRIEALDTSGVKVRGALTEHGRFEAPVVINACGPRCDEFSQLADPEAKPLMIPVLTYNLLVNRAPISNAAVAIHGSRMFFVTPHQKHMSFIGTMHQRWQDECEPSGQMIRNWIRELNRALPGWNLSEEDVLRTTPGILPAIGPGKETTAHRSTFHAHDIKGLFSVIGVKYTVAQAFAQKTIRRIFGKLNFKTSVPDIAPRANYVDPDNICRLSDEQLLKLLHEEAVLKAEDLIERRIDWITDSPTRNGLKERAQRLLNSVHASA